MAPGEVPDRLLEDRPARRDDREVPRSLGRREILDRRGQDVGLPYPRGGVDDALEGRRAALDLEPGRQLGGEALNGPKVWLAQVEPGTDGLK